MRFRYVSTSPHAPCLECAEPMDVWSTVASRTTNANALYECRACRLVVSLGDIFGDFVMFLWPYPDADCAAPSTQGSGT